MNVFLEPYKFHNQPPRGVLKKSYSENMQQIYRITPIPKCDFNKVVLQLVSEVSGLIECFMVSGKNQTFTLY